jgi:hypothetical protein
LLNASLAALGLQIHLQQQVLGPELDSPGVDFEWPQV